MKVVTYLIVASLLFMGCADQSITSTPDAGEAEPGEQQPEQEAAAIGDSITLQGMEDTLEAQVTVLKVVDPAKSGDQFSKPKKGNRYVGIQIKIKNIGTDVYADAPANGANLVDQDSQSFDASLFDEVKPGIGQPKISPGDERVGFLTFEVPEDAKLRTFQFTLDSGFGPNTGEWSL